ncbi:hypothetical protein BUALT_Bualt10G0000800 [Buddleja alternifolia]|uniref:WAT1-related protein n=1 Tax=Buddleja alternifolia TaxID=168488 RepID=A0AAV6WZN7_9LAMI|nr:hypothetical protein BUALT_Bualt10G0000800 [Buddleja alternifolia]
MRSLVQWYPVIVMIAIDLAFAISNILLKKIVGDGMDHLVFITYRQTVSSVFLSSLAFFLERRNRPKLTFGILCHLFLSAIIGASLTQYLFLLGVEYTSATFACAFLNMVPVVTFLLALPFGCGHNQLRFLLFDRFKCVDAEIDFLVYVFLLFCSLETVNAKYSSGRAKMLGAVVCIGGASLLTFYKGIPLFHFSKPQSMEQHTKLNSHIGRERWAIGSVALFAGTLCWSSWFLLQTYIGKRYPCQYSSTAILTFFSAIQSAVLSLSIDREFPVWVLKSRTDILIVLYAGMVGSGLCFVGMSWCVKKRGPVFTAAFSPLVQIMAALFDVPVLHEQLHLGSLMGSVIVIAGLYILLWGKDKEMRKNDIKLVQETEEIKDQEPEFQVKTRS